MSFDPEELRRGMRTWTTGVAVMMAANERGPHGMTVNSFASVSIDPPVISVVLQNKTQMFEMVMKSRAFGVTILRADQRELSERFAGHIHKQDRMDGIATRTLTTGAPFLTEGLALLDCRVIHTHAVGENTLFLAEVVDAEIRSADLPLVYHNRGYHHLTPQEEHHHEGHEGTKAG